MSRNCLEKHRRGYCGATSIAQCAKDRVRAISEARKTLSKMRKPGRWRINVFENLGWHWDLASGYITLSGDYYDSGTSQFSAMMADTLPPCGSPHYWYPGPGKGYFKDPNKAVDYVLRHAERFVKNVNSVVSKQRTLLK